MDIKKLVNKLLKISDDVTSLEKALVYSFANANAIIINKSKWLKEYLSGIDLTFCHNIQQNLLSDLSINDLINIFELLVPKNEKKEKGVVYTPNIIKEYIVENTIDSDSIPTVLDPTCGCGSFLITAAEYMHKKYSVSYSDVISHYLYGVDIDKSAIERVKALLSLLVLLHGEDENCSFNLICGDALDEKTFNKLQKLCKCGFDCIVGNPPYVRNKNMNAETKALLPNWESSSVGNVDLYMPFFEIGLKLLCSNGKLGFISPNSYLQSVNGRSLRKYFSATQYKLHIIDFRDSQVFDNVTSYTCITLVDKSCKSDIIDYLRLSEANTLENHTFSQYNMNDFPDGTPWRMREKGVDTVIHKLESTGTPLSNWKIRNGLATLKNDIFFFSPSSEDETYYYRIYDGENYRIEKSICIKVAKPNIIKNELELEKKMEIAIYPYIYTDNKFSIINELAFKTDYPEAYNFLKKYKFILQKRDKGKGNYPTWYAYGRTQGMNNFGSKLLIPYICDKPVAVLSLDPNVLFYCGYALISDDIEELKLLKVFLESEAFWYYIFHTSKPYSKGYMAFAKSYIVNFTIPSLSEDEKNYLLSLHRQEDINTFVWAKYDVDAPKN